MEATEYLKEKGRLTNGCGISCNSCWLSSDNNRKKIRCNYLEFEYPEEAVKIVKQWAKENPKKTYLSVLLEKFPKTILNGKGIPDSFCPNEIFGKGNCIADSCEECWNKEYEEE